jgi:hypothetical protein
MDHFKNFFQTWRNQIGNWFGYIPKKEQNTISTNVIPSLTVTSAKDFVFVSPTWHVETFSTYNTLLKLWLFLLKWQTKY